MAAVRNEHFSEIDNDLATIENEFATYSMYLSNQLLIALYNHQIISEYEKDLYSDMDEFPLKDIEEHVVTYLGKKTDLTEQQKTMNYYNQLFAINNLEIKIYVHTEELTAKEKLQLFVETFPDISHVFMKREKPNVSSLWAQEKTFGETLTELLKQISEKDYFLEKAKATITV
ncbi:MAG: hypothetical protein P4M12_07510 [Gammaproteobacteria bacterium]|nr:hypothetical protein [Gammaproteobacteria bacterium]